MRDVGLHIRLTETMQEVAQKAIRLKLPFFQSFFMRQAVNRFVDMTDEEIAFFVKNYRLHFGNLYLHGSYWINFAGVKRNGYRAYEREINLAKRLEFTHMVLHLGSANGGQTKEDGINACARMLNRVLKKEHQIKLIIENTAHGNLAVGSDINDFRQLLEKLNHPDKVGFSLDTAHAHVYGYDMSTTLGQDQFLALVDDAVGVQHVELIHLNDAMQPCGSRQDQHAVLGQGLIGNALLRRFVQLPEMAQIPVLMELPVIDEAQEQEILDVVRSW